MFFNCVSLGYVIALIVIFITDSYCRASGLDAAFDASEDGDGEQNYNSSPFTRLMDGKNT